MHQALLFDMDGVLLDTEVQAYEIWRDFLRKTQNYELSREEYANVSGSPPWEFDPPPKLGGGDLEPDPARPCPHNAGV